MPHESALCDCKVDIVQLELWKNAPDLKTLFNLNKLYIAGDLRIHPAHAIPLYAESAGLKRSLIELNEYGLFTFQGQPRKKSGKDEIKKPHTHDKEGDGRDAPINPTEMHVYCRCCSGIIGCWAECDKLSMLRQLPYIQFCLPVEGPGTATFVHAYRLAEALVADERVHTMVSWPKGLDIFTDSIERFNVGWVRADLTEAKKYIPEEDLAAFHHFKSKQGTSCTHEMISGATSVDFITAEWRPVHDEWSEANDYHLMRPRVPGFFLGPGCKTVVFGVNAVSWDDGVESLEALIMEKVKEFKFRPTFKMISNFEHEEESEESEESG